MSYLFLFLMCIALIAYFIHDYYKNGDYFNFLLEKNKIGPFLINHDFIYFMVCFFGTATPAIGAIYFFIRTIVFLANKMYA